MLAPELGCGGTQVSRVGFLVDRGRNGRAEHITGVVARKFPTVSLTQGSNLYVAPPSYYPYIHAFCGAFSAPIQREDPRS